MKTTRLIVLLIVTIFMLNACSDDNSPGTSNNNNNGSGNNTGGCAGGPSTVTDIDGNVYNVVSIGNQCWMKENLKTTHYKNGAPIPTNLTNAQWGATTTGAYADYNNDTSISAIYGRLYNWYAVADPQGLCPTSWHEPSDAEWNTLVNYLGGDSIAGGAMKEIGTSHWTSPNIGATNSSGFTGLPGGNRHYAFGMYSSIGFYGYWWSVTQHSTTDAYYRDLSYANIDVYRNNLHNKSGGFSVRCVRD